LTNIFRFSTSLTDNTSLTVSGRLQSWIDLDGSASGDRTGKKTMIGSTWAGNWWKISNLCFQKQMLWMYPSPNATIASTVIHHDAALEIGIGSSNCLNGNWKGNVPCQIIGNVTHFGRNEAYESLPLAVNPKITGPVIPESGGWFINFKDGSPKVLKISEIQIPRAVTLVLALPYPIGTQFTINISTASWCSTYGGNLCKWAYNQTDSLDNIINKNETLYFFNSSTELLYLRVFQGFENSLGKGKMKIRKTMNCHILKETAYRYCQQDPQHTQSIYMLQIVEEAH
jgi:hypothetical protein